MGDSAGRVLGGRIPRGILGESLVGVPLGVSGEVPWGRFPGRVTWRIGEGRIDREIRHDMDWVGMDWIDCGDLWEE